MFLVKTSPPLQPVCSGEESDKTSQEIFLQKLIYQGNAELLSISSDDSIWNSEDEVEDHQSDTGQELCSNFYVGTLTFYCDS